MFLLVAYRPNYYQTSDNGWYDVTAVDSQLEVNTYHAQTSLVQALARFFFYNLQEPEYSWKVLVAYNGHVVIKNNFPAQPGALPGVPSSITIQSILHIARTRAAEMHAQAQKHDAAEKIKLVSKQEAVAMAQLRQEYDRLKKLFEPEATDADNS